VLRRGTETKIRLVAERSATVMVVFWPCTENCGRNTVWKAYLVSKLAYAK
jgi:hypothetical protein